MLEIYKYRGSVFCSKLYFMKLIQTFEEFVKQYEAGRVTANMQLDIKNLLHLIKGNIQSLIACRIDIKDLMSQIELSCIGTLQDKLDALSSKEEIKVENEEEIKDEEKFQLHIDELVKDVNTLVNEDLDFLTRQVRLNMISSAFDDLDAETSAFADAAGDQNSLSDLKNQLTSLSTKRSL